ncbi:MAG: N-acetylmuramoyl-L-alanine amidase [Oscillospiraceae bacterium]|nr:N-acetylmuramoyl-L-alanine amidase [Oscillospiraceae bacterium]
MKRIFEKTGFMILCALIAFGVLAFLLGSAAETKSAFAPFEGGTDILIIDPGHGIPDGGAVSAQGAIESDINLQIAMKLRALSGFFGVETILTRQDEYSIHSPEAVTIRQQKVSDLKNRVALINGVDNAFLVSIHQNSYTNPKYSGAQVFYADDELSKAAAQRTQENLRLCLDASNERTVTPVPESVYLFQNINCGAILVECGFMSNPDEAELLQSDTYQKKIACAVLSALLQSPAGQGSEES